MSSPFIALSACDVRDGVLEQANEYHKLFIEIVESKDPRPVAVHGFLNEDETQFTSIQVNSDGAP